MTTPYTEAIGKWDTKVNDMKQYYPTLICVPATEWEQMNEEIKELREQKQATIKFDAQKCLKEMIAHWNRREAEMRGPMDKPYTFQMQNKHEPMPEVDEKGQMEKPPTYQQLIDALNEGKRIEADGGVWADCDDKGVSRFFDGKRQTGSWLIPFAKHTNWRIAGYSTAALKAAVDAGKTIVDDEGNEVFKSNGAYTFQEPNPIGSKWGPWWVISEKVYGRAGWRIKPEPEAPNYPLLLAELGMGKMLRSEDGYDLSWSRYTDRLTLYKGGMPTGIYTWNDVVEQVLEKHKNWKCV